MSPDCKVRVFYFAYFYKVKFTLFILSIVCCLDFWSNAQQPSYFLFGEKEFEGVDIYDVIQDQQKNYVIATDNGILFHDGYSFEKIDCDEMTNNNVFNFVKDKKGNIYCNNLNYQIFKITNGVCKLFAVTPELSRKFDLTLTVNDANQLVVASGDVFVYSEEGKLLKNTHIKQTYLSDPFCLKDGAVISVIANNLQIIRFKNNKFNYFPIKITGNNKGLKILSLHFYRLADEIVAFDKKTKKLFSFDEKTYALSYRTTLPEELKDQYLRLYSVGNRLWIASSISGLYAYDEHLEPLFQGHKIFDDYFISSICRDVEGNFLFSTFDKGILVTPNLGIEDVVPELSSYSLSRIASDGKGSIFLGTKNGEVLMYKNKQVSFLSEKGIKSIEFLYYWKERDLLFFDNYGMSVYDFISHKTTAYNFGSLKKLAPVSDKLLYAGFNVGLAELNFDATTRVFSKRLVPNYASRTSLVAYDKKRKLIYFSSADGVKIMKRGVFSKLLKHKGKLIFANDMKVFDDMLCIATREKGLLLIRGDRVIRHISPNLGGRKVYVYKFQVVNQRIYANSSEGLLVMNLKGDILHVLNKAAGIASNKIIDFYVDDNYLWLIHARGLQKIRHKDFGFSNREVSLGIVPFLNGDKNAHSDKNIVLDYSKRKITFELKVATISNRENIRYLYKLSGNDAKMNALPYEQNKVTYNALEPGVYDFEARLEVNGKLGPVQRIRFEVLSPFYKAWWFNVLLILIGLGIISFFYFRKLRRQQEKSRQINELNLSKLTAIRSQMNPHFIFNSLNSIQDLVLKGDVENSYTFITKFSNLVRKTLNYSDKEFISLEKEIQLIELYLTLEKLRFKDEFSFELHYDESLLEEELEIPPMLIQPFVENALVHGLLHLDGRKKINISFELGENLKCIIRDNGIGRKKAQEIKERQNKSHDSFSVNASKKRFAILSKLYGKEAGFHYVDLNEDGVSKGTEVHLNIPYKRKF